MSDNATRAQIVEAADQLLYEKGFEYTSFGDLAKAVGISRGNVTFHFATRDDILAAVIDRRLERTKKMLECWEAGETRPEQRIKSFVNILIVNRTKIMLYGCPVGTLCAELAKLEHPALSHANRVFGLFRDWLREHFVQLGFKKNADALALHVLAWSQGVATLASAIRDEGFVRREVRQLEGWLNQLIKHKPGKRLSTIR